MTNAMLSAGLTLGLLAAAPGPNQVQLAPSKDNTLFEPDDLGERSNALGPQMFAGRIGGFGGGVGLRRGLLAFDVAGSVPAGAMITSATLTLECSRVPLLDNGTPRTHALHRATADWGEGTSEAGINVGTGDDPTPGDATWSHTFFPGSFWASPGGDFVGGASGTISVPSTGSYTFASTPQLVADVQDMLDSPAGNFGWVLLGEEVASPVARAFDTREAPTYPNYDGTAPVLTIEFTLPAVPAVGPWGLGALTLLLVGGGALLASRRARPA
ncbi:MAG TPA: hypothetical protein VF530_03620 [Planctomycetota bacterium]